MSKLLDIFLHLDTHLQAITTQYGTLTYAILFLIVFCETGLVVTPFLPGDSLLFAAGAISALGGLHPAMLLLVLGAAAIAGDTANYWIGWHLGKKAFERENTWFFRKEHLLKAEQFYEKHGGKTIILARFMPFIRTFAPFVAGVGRMNYRKFLLFNVAGGLLWVSLFTLAGYFFGNLPFVQKNFHFFIFGIVLISIIPGICHSLRRRYCRKQPPEALQR